jgi:hypothetical protein
VGAAVACSGTSSKGYALATQCRLALCVVSCGSGPTPSQLLLSSSMTRKLARGMHTPTSAFTMRQMHMGAPYASPCSQEGAAVVRCQMRGATACYKL